MRMRFALTVTSILLMSTSLSGCRWGNFVEKAESLENLTGYYRSAPLRLTFEVTLQRPGQPVEVRRFAGLTESLPDDWDIFLTDPAGLSMDPSTGYGYLLGIVGDKGYKTPVTVAKKGAFTLDPVLEEIPLMDSPPCKHVWTMGGSGKLNQAPRFVYQDLPMRGQISVTASGTRSYVGTCADVLTLFASCYGDATKCPGNNSTEQNTWRNFLLGVYSPAVQAGGITAAEIEYTQKVSYTLVYE